MKHNEFVWNREQCHIKIIFYHYYICLPLRGTGRHKHTYCQVHERIGVLMCPPFGLNERTFVDFTVNWPETFPYLLEISSPEVAPVSEVTESTRSKILAFRAWTAVENMK